MSDWLSFCAIDTATLSVEDSDAVEWRLDPYDHSRAVESDLLERHRKLHLFCSISAVMVMIRINKVARWWLREG